MDIDDDKAFLDAMTAKRDDPARPLFSREEIARINWLLTGEKCAPEDEWIDYCKSYMDEQRSDMCFYK